MISATVTTLSSHHIQYYVDVPVRLLTLTWVGGGPVNTWLDTFVPLGLAKHMKEKAIQCQTEHKTNSMTNEERRKVKPTVTKTDIQGEWHRI